MEGEKGEKKTGEWFQANELTEGDDEEERAQGARREGWFLLALCRSYPEEVAMRATGALPMLELLKTKDAPLPTTIKSSAWTLPKQKQSATPTRSSSCCEP